MTKNTLAGAALAVALTACAVRLGGPSPEEYRTMAYDATGVAAEDAGRFIREAGADIVLLTAEQDSAWFARVAAEAGLALSGPGRTEPMGKAFLTNLEILGDTSIVLGVADGSRMHMHDALYEIEENRHIDLMLIGIGAGTNLREAVRTLLSYIATDVGPNAAIMMAIDTPTPEAGDTVATLLQAAYTSANECASTDGSQPTPRTGRVRLFYGPSARVQCQSARILSGAGTPTIAELLVGR